MIGLLAFLLLLFFCSGSCLAADAAVDVRPLEVTVVPTFTQLQWPDWVLGLDEGLRCDPRPMIITGAGDGSGRMFVATEYGTIHTFENRADVEQMHTFMDIRERVKPYKPNENEEGFLGLAFHPRFKANGEFFVYYSIAPTEARPHASRISRFRTKAGNPQEADPESEEILLEIPDLYWNHNGGTVVFGPDGYLYIVVGDGGWFNDPHMNSQNLHSLFGKILRIDVDHSGSGLPYTIPADNPFRDQPRFARGEIWAYGLRNPWRLAFDRETGVGWAADVGQDAWEEIDLIVRGGNYGWNLREGKHPFGPGGFPESEKLIEPIWEYPHEVGKSITGGHVYRGKKFPVLQGSYLYADYVTGQVWALWYDANRKQVTANRTLREKGFPVLTFGEDDAGEIFLTSEREIFTLVPAE